MPWLILHLLGGKLKAAWGWLTGSLTHVLLAGLALVSLYAFTQHRAAGKWHNAAVKCAQGRDADRKAYAAAQQQAEAAQRAANLATEARYSAIARNADETYTLALADAQRATERFIAAGGVRGKAADRSPGPAPAPTQGDGPQSGDRSGAAAELVVVAADDVRICSENTTRLEAVRTWALGL